ncbi:transmembrane transporter [Malassezia pachydermatis]
MDSTSTSTPAPTKEKPGHSAPQTSQDNDDDKFSAFRPSIKALIVFFAALAGFMSPFGVNIYVPALPEMSEALHISNAQTLISVTTYMIFQGIAPSVWAPLSDVYGRRPIIILTMVVFLAANLGLSFANVYWALLVLRMVQACGASSAIAIGAGSISDVSRFKERGRYMSYFQSGALLGPCIGPIVGGLLAHRWDWHAVFFFLSALGGVLLVFFILFLPESLRALVGDGSQVPVSIWRSIIPYRALVSSSDVENGTGTPEKMNMPPQIKLSSLGIEKPWLMLLRKEVALIVTCYAFPFTVFSVATATFSPTLATNYGYNEIVIGLCYLPLGAGFATGSVIGGSIVDKEYAYHKKKYGSEMNLFKARIGTTPYFLVFFLLTTLAFEWLLDQKVHIAAPLIIIFFSSASSMVFFTAINSLLVDVNLSRAASVVASLNIGRCLLGAIFTAFAQYVIDAIGNGWTFTIFTLVALVISLPIMALLRAYGPVWLAKVDKAYNS